ncbi:unnamed protein product [Dibothriocephalus latus]|uniref:BROMI middle region domain-containing protein n=1 Tax=Dibothriocephalus latus TaxID=60516 RepID=A0A3P6UV08_DIBLA|nr:unnamed protein product [Dibothriocephalus latus]
MDYFVEPLQALTSDLQATGCTESYEQILQEIGSKKNVRYSTEERENLRAAVDCIFRENEEEEGQEKDEGSVHTGQNFTDPASTTSGTIQAEMASLATTETESIDRISGFSRPLYDSRIAGVKQDGNRREGKTEGCTFLSQTELTELARLLDPQHHNAVERTTALRQIVNLPVLDVQACESWMAAASLQTPTQRTSTAAHERASTSSPIFSLPATATTPDEIPECVSNPPNMPAYSIRTGILEALNDEDDELWSLAMQFLAKGFATTSANVKECYCVLTEYIEDQFSGSYGPMPKLSPGLDISNPHMQRLFRAFCLFNEVNKQITQLWLRYPEK